MSGEGPASVSRSIRVTVRRSVPAPVRRSTVGAGPASGSATRRSIRPPGRRGPTGTGVPPVRRVAGPPAGVSIGRGVAGTSGPRVAGSTGSGVVRPVRGDVPGPGGGGVGGLARWTVRAGPRAVRLRVVPLGTELHPHRAADDPVPDRGGTVRPLPVEDRRRVDARGVAGTRPRCTIDAGRILAGRRGVAAGRLPRPLSQYRRERSPPPDDPSRCGTRRRSGPSTVGRRDRTGPVARGRALDVPVDGRPVGLLAVNRRPVRHVPVDDRPVRLLAVDDPRGLGSRRRPRPARPGPGRGVVPAEDRPVRHVPVDDPRAVNLAFDDRPDLRGGFPSAVGRLLVVRVPAGRPVRGHRRHRFAQLQVEPRTGLDGSQREHPAEVAETERFESARHRGVEDAGEPSPGVAGAAAVVGGSVAVRPTGGEAYRPEDPGEVRFVAVARHGLSFAGLCPFNGAVAVAHWSLSLPLPPPRPSRCLRRRSLRR
ncbi:hypothetical protein BRD00_02775 [Halobacteriales archaeon QS_8_69_26]|nr:MAG: hypothetical protein BRD00_02775 [Halobacteriales archaeon QS_8_69_26]